MTTATKTRRADIEKAIEVIGECARHLENIGNALLETHGVDAGLLELAERRARDAANDLWSIESDAAQQDWWSGGLEGDYLYRALYTLPLLAIAAQSAATNAPDSCYGRGVGDAGTWVAHHASDVSRDMRDWIITRRRMLEERNG